MPLHKSCFLGIFIRLNRSMESFNQIHIVHKFRQVLWLTRVNLSKTVDVDKTGQGLCRLARSLHNTNWQNY